MTAASTAMVTILSASAAVTNPDADDHAVMFHQPQSEPADRGHGRDMSHGIGNMIIVASTRQISPRGIFAHSSASYDARGRIIRSKRRKTDNARPTMAA
jgi:hypothetical protein